MRAPRTAFGRAGVVLALTLAALPVCAQPASVHPLVFQMDFSHPGLSPSHWTMTIHPDGSGHFRAERGDQRVQRLLDTVNVDRDIQLSAAFAEHVFATASQRNWSQAQCESSIKVAFQGWKEFTYSGPAGAGACRFNYSEDRKIQALSDSLIAVADTILEGARLEMLLQHDRLGLDKEMESLSEDANMGRAQQLCVIRGTLQRLAEDPGVLERVRKRAHSLLARAEK